jgi:hypothetical protein
MVLLPPNKIFLPENLVVTGFWFGKEPQMNVFFKTFFEEINDINRNCTRFMINNQFIKFKIIPLICTCDTLARDVVQNKILFKGYNGCGYIVLMHPKT